MTVGCCTSGKPHLVYTVPAAGLSVTAGQYTNRFSYSISDGKGGFDSTSVTVAGEAGAAVAILAADSARHGLPCCATPCMCNTMHAV